MPKRFDGTGVVQVQASDVAFHRMKLDLMEPPVDSGYWDGDYFYQYANYRSMGADSERYRVLWPSPPGEQVGKLPTTSFTLSGSHRNETLFVLAQFMRDQGVEFIKLANKHGNGFKDLRLWGS